MQLFFGITYLIFFFGVVVASLFIMFHLSRYSLNRRLATGMTLLFVVVTAALLMANMALFFSLPLDSLLIPVKL
jgi:heme A synthase